MIDRKVYGIVASLFVLGLVACGGSEQPQVQQPGRPGAPGGAAAAAAPVRVEPVTRSDISQYVLKNTTLEAEQWVEVRTRAGGQVVAVLKEEGDRIVAGAVIARLDDDMARITVAQREVAFREAQQRYEREAALFERNLGSKEGYSNATTQLESAKSLLEQAQLSLSYTVIQSPIAGLVTRRSIEVGNMVTNNQIVATVANFDPLLARIQVTEKDFGRISVGLEARITVEAASNREFRGRVKMISPIVEPESGTIKVTVEVPRPEDGFLRPGMFASVYIITETRRNTLVIPKRALVLEGEGNQVFVYEKDEESGQGKAQRRRVEIGFADSDRLEVLSGLSDGDRVITVGQEGLRPGSAVRLVGEAAPVVTSQNENPARQGGAQPAISGNAGAASAAVAPGGGPPGTEAERLQRMVAMIEGVPEAKKLYEERVKKDPELPKSMEKMRAFMGELREKGLIEMRGRQGN